MAASLPDGNGRPLARRHCRALAQHLQAARECARAHGRSDGHRPDEQRALCSSGEEVGYDSLIVAAGFRYHYFGNDAWERAALDLQGLDKALAIRRRILAAYERAEQESDPALTAALLTFVIVGAGPTGVELAGSIAEMARHTLKGDFRRIDPAQTKDLLIEAADRVLPAFDPDLSVKAQRSLEKIGVTVLTGAMVQDIAADHVRVARDGATERIATHTVMWAAGVKASPLGELLHRRTTAHRPRRVQVAPTLACPAIRIYTSSGIWRMEQAGQPLPGLAPVAMQQGNTPQPKSCAASAARKRKPSATSTA